MTPPQEDVVSVVRTITPALKRNGRTPKRHSRVQRLDLGAARAWNADRNVVGFGVGPKRAGNETDYSVSCLIVFVVRKLGTSRVPKTLRIPRRLAAASVERRLVTDVVEVGSVPMLQAAASISPGSDVAHFTMRDGTVTAIVATRTAPRQPRLLSCCHVFAPPQAVGRQIEAPPDLSAVTFTNHVADVTEIEPLKPGGNLANRMDAALAFPLPGGPGLSNSIAGVGRITSASRLKSGEFLPNGVRRVLGVGAMTPRMQGDILAENVSSVLSDPFGRIFLYQDLVAYRPAPVTQAGDSGMPILVNTPNGLQLVGMHIGIGRIVGPNVGAAFFVPIAPVLERFSVDVIV